MRLQEIALSSLLWGASIVTAQLNERFVEDGLVKRQQFTPTTTTAEGATCADAFGDGYVTCREGSSTVNRLCYNPSLGQTCCENPGQWACPAGSFCLVSGSCCPNGKDPQSCAADNHVSVSAGFKPSQATNMPYAANSTKPIGGVQSTAVKSSPASYYTGAASNPKSHMAGLAGIVIGAVAMI